MPDKRVLVLNATGKTGTGVCRALKDAGYAVHGTTRSPAGGAILTAAGVTPVIANYTNQADLDRAFAESGARKVFILTDYFQAARKSVALEVEQGKAAIAAARAADVDHLVFMSVADAECFDERTHHLHAKVALEAHLRAQGDGLPYSIVRPCAFFENLDDAANWNPLKKGVVRFLTRAECKWTSTYDIGRAAAVHFGDPAAWLGRTTDVISWQGDLDAVAAALATVSGVPTKAKLAMPRWVTRLLLNDLHHMLLYYEQEKGPKGTPAEFKKVVPDAMSAEDWFRSHGRYADGEPICA